VAQLRQLVMQETSFGLRWPSSAANNQELRWLERKLRLIKGMRIRSEGYRMRSWQPAPLAKDGVSRDIARAGGLTVFAGGSKRSVPTAGVVPFAKPTSSKGGPAGPLVYLPGDQEITPENAAGKVVIRDFPEASIPYVAFQLLGLWAGPDSTSRAGDYTRPWLSNRFHSDMMAGSAAGAAGIVFAADIPGEQLRGYFDPHSGTQYRVPAVWAGSGRAGQLKQLAAEGASARVTVKAKVGKGKTRNLIATLPGQSPQRMILNTNHDGYGWVQDNGVAGLIAVGRYYASLPMRCRTRTLVLAFGASHQSLATEGTDRYSERIDHEYDAGTVSFAFPIEHLGTREILPVPHPSGVGRLLRFTGRIEPWLWAVGPSTTMRDAVIASAQRRAIPEAAVLRGAAAPTATVPTICSFGGLGNLFHRRLVPTTAIISGPWSLWAPSFGRSALDFGVMRKQLLAVGDTILTLDGLPQADIAGDYTMLRAQRAAGAATCSKESWPLQAPGPGG
jgi:hypothetical protein